MSGLAMRTPKRQLEFSESLELIGGSLEAGADELLGLRTMISQHEISLPGKVAQGPGKAAARIF